jgi:hypothetical protein
VSNIEQRIAPVLLAATAGQAVAERQYRPGNLEPRPNLSSCTPT